MGLYITGASVQHLLNVRINGTPGTTGNVTGFSGSVYGDGVLLGGTSVTTTALTNGNWRVSYTVPAGLAHGTDLACVVSFTAGGVGKSVVYHDQVEDAVTPATVYSYLQSHPINVGLTTAARDALVAAIELEAIDASGIASQILCAGVSDAIVDAGPLDRHSLGTLVLMATNADTTSNDGYLTVRHPDTDIAVFTFQITTGAGCPIQSIT